MSDVKIVDVQNDKRESLVPLQALQYAICDSRNHSAKYHKSPHPTQNPHVAIFVALVGFCIARGRPHEFDVEDTVLDCCQVGV